jgi:hypothetical protein
LIGISGLPLLADAFDNPGNRRCQGAVGAVGREGGRMRAVLGMLTGLALLVPGVAVAQSGDGMDLQRCIWSCLYNSPGASSPQYHACVAQMCQQTAPAAPVQGWTSGLAADGVTRFAGVAVADGSGRGVYFMCAPGGTSYLALYRMAGPPGSYRLVVDGYGYALWFDRVRVELAAPLGFAAPVIRHMSGGQVLRIETGFGGWMAAVPLAGAGAAIQAAMSGCQG